MKITFYLKRLLLFLYIVPLPGSGQIYSNTFTGISMCPTPGNNPVVAPNATGTILVRNSLTCVAAASVFNSSTLNNTAAVNNNSYIEFSVTANYGYQMNITSLSFFSQGSITAPNQMEVRYSTDGFATSTSWGAAPLTVRSPGRISTWDFADFTTAAGITVTFRIYPYGTQRVDLGTAKASASATIRLDNITLNGTVITPMPVKLVSFSGSYDQSVILLKWETAWEEQNEGFEIQRSNDARNFSKIGYVQGNATTKSKSVYEFTDADIKSEQPLYFRLKQYDLDGNYEFSRTIAVNTSSKQKEENLVYPNPNKGTFLLKPGDASLLNIQLFNFFGKEIPIKINPAESPGFFQINAGNNLVPGVYVLKINADNGRAKSIKVLIDN